VLGQTPLHYAVRRERLDLVEALLDLGANPLVKDAKGQTLSDCCSCMVEEEEETGSMAGRLKVSGCLIPPQPSGI
jgi:hypothetical protein